MRFVQLSLTDYIPMYDAGIKKITVHFTSRVQIIIGTNGSGKSSFLRMLSTNPPPKTIFGDKKQGYRLQVIEHDGVEYRLESEYHRPSSPHAFYIEGNPENINTGRTTEIQKELILEHLGITPFVDDLIMNRFEFPKWKNAQRRDFLMAHNPDDIGFVYKMTKEVASKIRACKSNLARLQSRKILLEQDLLSPEMMETLLKEKDKIERDLDFFQQTLTDLEVATRVLGTPVSRTTEYAYEGIKKTLRSIRYELGELSHIERDTYQRNLLREQLQGQIATCDHRLKTTEEAILQQVSELEDLEVQYRALIPDGDLKDIEDTITNLERDRDRLNIDRPEIEISRQELTVLYDEFETLREKLHLFETCAIPLYPKRKRDRRDRALNNAQYRKSAYEMKLSDLRSRHQELSKRHTMSPSDIPSSPCAKDACPLYAHFMESYEHAENQRQEVQQQIGRLQKRLTRLDTFIAAMHQYFEHSRIYADRITWLVEQANHRPLLRAVLRKIDILSTLRHNPNRILQNLKLSYDHIDQWLQYRTVLDELETAHALKSRCVGTQSEDTVKLVVNIENLKKSLVRLREELSEVAKNRAIYRKDLDAIYRYEELKNTALQIQADHIEYARMIGTQHELDRLALIKRSILELRQRAFSRMGELERTLKAQAGLQERYQEEVMSELGRIEKEQKDQEAIEKALVAIPRDSMVDFLNGVFEQANLLIAQVWTVPFEIDLLKEDHVLDYDFMVSGDNESSREMSQCSEGQTDMLSLAINLALRMQLGHLNIPLCLDEPGRTFDDQHKTNLVKLLKRMLDDGIVSQLFIVNHHASIHEGFADSETMVTREENVMVPEVYNAHCTIE